MKSHKGFKMRKGKCILMACLMFLQVGLLVQFAAAAPMAHGRFNGVDTPGFAVPGGRLVFSATAVNDGDSTGWFRICISRVGPSYHEYFPNPRDESTSEGLIQCSKTLQIDPGERMTHSSTKLLMMSVPSETFWIILFVQQERPILVSEDGGDLINLNIDELREVVVTNMYTVNG